MNILVYSRGCYPEKDYKTGDLKYLEEQKTAADRAGEFI
jgi:hypothetical protein